MGEDAGDPSPPRADAGQGERAPSRRTVAGLAGLASASAIGAAIMAVVVFPYGSVNDDEAIYRLQAHTLAGGHLFPAVPDQSFASSFRPWLAALVQHHYVLKYTPVEGALLAASFLIAGSFLPALMGTAAALACATYWLATELLDNEREALVATALVVLSPLVVVQSGLLLAYLTTLVLLEVFAAALVRGSRGRAGPWLAMSGFALGVAAAIRPYDALIFAIPLLIWAIGRKEKSALRDGLWWLLGGLGPALAFFVYNAVATGSPLKLPFNLQDSHDTMGFGLRRLNPTEDLHHFGPLQGLVGIGVHVGFFAIWVAGGPALIGLALLALRRGMVRGPARALAATALTVPLGYFFFWGPWNAGTIWGGIRLVGPFYLMPVVVVAGVLGAHGLPVVARAHRHWTPRIVAAMVIVTVATTTPVIAADARYSRQDGRAGALARTVPGPALVILPPKPGFIMFPHYSFGQEDGLGGPVVYAAASGKTTDLDLVDHFRDRIPYSVTFSGSFLPHRPHLGVQLNQLVEHRGRSFDLRAQASTQRLRTKNLALTLSAGGPVMLCGPPDARGGWAIQVGADGATTCAGAAGQVVAHPGSDPSITLKYSSASGFRDEVHIPARVSDGDVTLLVPGPQAALMGRVRPPLAVTLAPS